MVSFLREQRNCKVALILNDERLGEEERRVFETHLEKVVDVSQTPTEAAEIGAPDSDSTTLLVQESCAALRVTNIRTIRRTLALVRNVKGLIADYYMELRVAVIKSLALFVWCRDDPEEAPSLEYLASRTQEVVGIGSVDERRPDVDQAGWRSLLNVYGYAWTDGLDLALIEGVRDGHFDAERLRREAKEIASKVARNRAAEELQLAWRRFQELIRRRRGRSA